MGLRTGRLRILKELPLTTAVTSNKAAIAFGGLAPFPATAALTLGKLRCSFTGVRVGLLVQGSRGFRFALCPK